MYKTFRKNTWASFQLIWESTNMQVTSQKQVSEKYPLIVCLFPTPKGKAKNSCI